MTQSRMLLFASTEFTDAAGDDEQTNPGVFGRSLAQWLARELHSRGFSVGDVIPEDFGWCIPLQSMPRAIYVTCSSAEFDSGAEFETWQVFVFTEGGFISRLLGRDTDRDRVAEVFAAVKDVLQASPQVKRLREVWM